MKTAPGITWAVLVTCLGSWAMAAPQDDPLMATDEAAGIEFFETHIRPVLVRECYSCHSAQTGQTKGGLQLDTKTGLLLGGDSGPAVVPGSLEDSPLWSALNHEDYVMPPGKQLAPKILANFREWIEMGAPDPRVPEAVKTTSTVTDADIEQGRQFWSFVAPEKPPVPAAQASWPVNEIDRFVLDRLHASELEPAADTTPETLLRRLCVDLTGLPPTPQQRAKFSSRWDQDPDGAVAWAVDRLLDSPQFGERWGRHWLDVARYAESTGKEINATFPHAWRYRDYVIDSFNDDKPYDRFIQEQIAGDLLPVDSDEEWAGNLVATGFLALGPKTLTERNPRQFSADLIDEQIDATTRVVLGVSVACARCHDHKFDPIPQTDYYAMAGIFRSTATFFGTLGARQNRRPSKLIRLPVDDEQPIGTSLDRSQVRKLQQRMEEIDEEIRKVAQEARAARRDSDSRDGQAAQRLRRQIQGLQAQQTSIQNLLDAVDSRGTPRALCMGVQPTRQPLNANFLARGEVDQPGDPVPRGFVRVLGGDDFEIAMDSSGRLELARWMTDKDNPLTARVMVNRIWQHLLGQAIVTSTDNFGATGQPPSHPELLDWLAVTFMEDDWSVKQMIRRITTSRTYRMAATWDERAFELDPENQLLWRANARRLDAEVLRDSLLAVSGQLDLQRPLASDVARAGDTVARDGALRSLGDVILQRLDDDSGQPGRNRGPRARGNASADSSAPQADPFVNYRSVYLPIVRDHVPRALEVFDFAESSMIVGTRETSNTPDQGLFFLNNRLVTMCSDALARRLLEEQPTVNKQIALAFELCYGRAPDKREMSAARKFYNTFDVYGKNQAERKLAALCQSLMASAEFRIVD